MSYIKQIENYVTDNPEGYWFKRKLYGWGWMPITWQGWAVTLGYAVILIGFALTIDESAPPKEVAFTFLLPLFILTVLLVGICYAKGEKPKWQWGFPKDEGTNKN